MLIEFNIENFRSFKEKVTFSMLATKDTALDGNLIKEVLDDSLLKSCYLWSQCFWKTNVLLALDFFKALVLHSHTHQKGEGIRFTPFKLDKKCLSQPTNMSILFIKNNVKYSYYISFDSEKSLRKIYTIIQKIRKH